VVVSLAPKPGGGGDSAAAAALHNKRLDVDGHRSRQSSVSMTASQRSIARRNAANPFHRAVCLRSLSIHRCKKRFLTFFLFWSRFLRSLTFFILQTFFIFKKRWQSSQRQAH